jgi:hypothetical protein
MPISVEELNVDDYANLVRTPTQEDYDQRNKYAPKRTKKCKKIQTKKNWHKKAQESGHTFYHGTDSPPFDKYDPQKASNSSAR